MNHPPARRRRIPPPLRFLPAAAILIVFPPGAHGGTLTAAQETILATPAPAVPEVVFSFADPAGPQFGDEEKQRQREAGKTVLPMVTEAFGRAADSVRIPPGNYRFGKESWDREGVVYALEFRGLKRTPEHTFTINATGATFWFDLPDDQAPTAHFCLGFKECENIVLRGATLDRGTRGHVEGRITAMDHENNRMELQLSPGLTVPATFSGKLEQRVVPFKADGTFCAPLYALQKGGTRLKYQRIDPGSTAGRYWVTMQDRALLETIRDPDWLRAYGERGVLRVGDGLSCVHAVSCSIEMERCAHLTMDGLRVFIPKGWGAEWGGEGGHLWKNCWFGPRPGTSQWQGGEGFMFCATRHGTTLDNVSIRHTTDDTANFHGYWGQIEKMEGNRITFQSSHEFRRAVLRDVKPGDRLVFRDKNSGAVLGEAALVSIDGNTVTVDKPLDLTNAIVEWPDHSCAGWTIRNCHWQDNYQRLLIQSGPGTVEKCTFTRHGSAIELNSVMPYVEGGVPHDITIRDNVFTEVNPMPHGATITSYSHTFGEGIPLFRNISITGNTFVRPGGPAIALTGIEDGVVSGNRFEGIIKSTALAKPSEPREMQAIRFGRSTGIRVEGNTIVDPDNLTESDPLTGSKLLGLDPGCADIQFDGNPVAHVRGPAPVLPAKGRQFILINLSAADGETVMARIAGDFKASAGSPVRVGVARIFSYFGRGRDSLEKELREFLDRCAKHDLPALVSLEGEYWWEGRPDLWNWWQADQPGYDPNNRENVEWTSWDPADALKISWLNWGRQIRVLPPPNLMSPRYRAACHAEMRKLVPIVTRWWQGLPPEKKDLFVGIKVGWESSIGVNKFFYPNGNALIDRPAGEDPQTGIKATEIPARGVVQIGYAALKTSGLRGSGEIAEEDLVEVVRRHLGDLSAVAARLGVPRDRLFTHIGGWKEGELLYDAALNEFSSPGWSFYRHARNPAADVGVQRALKKSDATHWAAVEWLHQGPNTTEAWRTSLENTLIDPKCRFLCIFNWKDIEPKPAALDAIRAVASPGTPAGP